eukprot:15440004-Heterocapsa_arctica.AAC.1
MARRLPCFSVARLQVYQYRRHSKDLPCKSGRGGYHEPGTIPAVPSKGRSRAHSGVARDYHHYQTGWDRGAS